METLTHTPIKIELGGGMRFWKDGENIVIENDLDMVIVITPQAWENLNKAMIPEDDIPM